jgi:predicted esterase
MKLLSILLCPLVLSLFGSLVSAAEPTHANLRYSKDFDRSVLDLWTVKSSKPVPLVVYFHGGGFNHGDKTVFNKNQFLQYHGKGVAFASVNYPFLVHVKRDYFKIMDHCAEAIRFLQANAKKYNIDKKRISVMGASAGALISCHLGHGHDLSLSSVFAFQQPKGTPLMTYPKLRKDGPPIILYTGSGLTDQIHHPDNAKLVHKRCKELGVKTAIYGSDQSGLPLMARREIHNVVMKFFFESWNLSSPK